MIDVILSNKPVLVGLHLGFAILGIDCFLWLAAEIGRSDRNIAKSIKLASAGILGFVLSWLTGGYYYVKYYGPLVKPIIKQGVSPWAHAVVMEAKEHIFLFVIPMALSVWFLSRLSFPELQQNGVLKPLKILILSVAALTLLIGLMGFIISAAARWA